MYNAIITKLRAVREHPNADRLKLATCWGSQVIVGIEREEGELGVYFPTDGQLSEIFTKMNNLYRKNDMNHDSSKSGYISHKRRIRTQKLRDEVGDGLWLPIDCLEFTGKQDIYEDWDHGHEFKEIDGIPICRKYVNPNTRKAQKNREQQKKKEAKISSKMFKQHFSTKHVARKLDTLDLDREVVITEKVHGTCMSAETKVELKNGNKKQINKIKEGDKVLGYNHKLNKIITSKVIKTHTYEPKNNWVTVKGKRRGCGTGNHYFKVTCTKSHEFFTEGKYIEAQNLTKNHTVYLVRHDNPIDSVQEQALLGKSLGDGYFCKRPKVGKLEYSHKKEHKAYLDWYSSILKDLQEGPNKLYKSGYGSKILRNKTKETRTVYNTLNKSKKDIINELDWFGLTILYLDDGSLSHNKSQEDRASFAICSFNKEQAEEFERVLKENFNIPDPKLYKDSEGYYRIRLNKDCADYFYSQIAKYVPSCMSNKLPKKYRNVKTELPKRKTINNGKNLIPHKITEVETISRPRAKRYDITTETGNFFAHGVLVHNSGRTGRIQLTGGEKSWKDKIANYFGYQKKPVWAYVNGSRRVDFFPDKLAEMREKEDKSASQDFKEKSLSDKFTFIKDFLSGAKSEKSQKLYKEIKSMEPREVSLNYLEGKLPGFATWYQAKSNAGNPWHDPTLRDLAGAQFDEFLHKGETIFYEIAGFEPNGSHIMPGGGMKQLGQEFVDKYGDSIEWSYGCGPKEHSVWVYRITMTNEDGKVAEYSWDEVKRRCKEMNVNHVPELYHGSLLDLLTTSEKSLSDPGELNDKVIERIENFSKGESTITPAHIKEGVCVRQGTNIYKHKSIQFKILEGIIKESDTIDTEEAS